ncbi:hypothetical protein H6F89_02380 [Cyanobacteria bacterium FACHB-63]|nr:hypothetical protein [Cyanobacteria bacterium FACHB-63]
MQYPKSVPSVSLDRRTLNYQEAYPCPICRHGQVEGLTLMDAFACNFCRHIFTANLNEQTVHVEDSSQPMTWRWNGRKWQAANQTDVDLSIVIWLVGLALVVLPPSLIWLPSQVFIPLDGSSGAWFPKFWIALTFACHFGFVSWLLAEHYQLPLYVAGKVRIRRWLERFSS